MWDNYPDPKLEMRRFAICKRLVEVTQKLVEQKQTKDKNKTQEQQEQPPPKMKETPQPINLEPQSPPLEIPIENSIENLLKQVVDDSKDQNRANIPKISKEWPEKNWSMVEQAKQGNNTFASAPMEEIYADPN